MNKNFSNPKIYTANGDLKKRWIVYFSFQNPETGRLKRVTPFYGNANKYKTKEDRLYVLSAYRKKLLELLKKGYNPFEDNTALFQKQHTKASKHKKTTLFLDELVEVFFHKSIYYVPSKIIPKNAKAFYFQLNFHCFSAKFPLHVL